MKIAFNPQLLGVYYYQTSGFFKCLKCKYFSDCEECVKNHFKLLHIGIKN